VLGQLPALALLFLLIFGLNVIPAFAPPTWMALAFVGFRFPDTSPPHRRSRPGTAARRRHTLRRQLTGEGLQAHVCTMDGTDALNIGQHPMGGVIGLQHPLFRRRLGA